MEDDLHKMEYNQVYINSSLYLGHLPLSVAQPIYTMLVVLDDAS